MADDILSFFKNHLFEEKTFRSEPMSVADELYGSSAQAVFVSPKENVKKLSFSGKIRIPHQNGHSSVQLAGAVSLKNDDNPNLSLIGGDGKAYLGTWNIAPGIVLCEGVVRLVFQDGKASARIAGNLRLINGINCEIGGSLDAELLNDSNDPDRIYIGTLLTDAYLHVGKSIHLSGGTIKFELCTKPHDPAKPLPYCIDEMDEYLLQSTERIPLGPFQIVGTEREPVSMSLGIDALSSDAVKTTVSVYPAVLLAPVLGEQNELFVSGPQGQNPFSINATGTWSAFICSRPHLHLRDPSDPSGPFLIQGGSFFIGEIAGDGFSSARLKISSDFCHASAFPDSSCPQEMPGQRLVCSVSETGAVEMKLQFNPISIGGFMIVNPEGANKPLQAFLSESGLVFDKGYRVTGPCRPPISRIMPSFAIDNQGRIWVNAGSKKTGIRNWFSET